MSKKQYIKLEYDAPAFVLGIASNDRIWKVCWNINQSLQLDLSTGVQELSQARGQEIYYDVDSDPDYEYLLFENTQKGRKVPRKAKEFRFWMVIKPKREEEPELGKLLLKLNDLDNVLLALDLSDEKDIKKLIP